VARALKPSPAKTFAEPASQGLGMMNASPSCNARKSAPFWCWEITIATINGRGHAGVRCVCLFGRLSDMRQRLTLITLGVHDLSRSRNFYEALGWKTGAGPDDDVVFFQAGDMVVALWDRARLAEDSSVADAGGWGGVTLAHNVGSRDEVDAVTEEARAAGATIGREPAETFWGGYSSIFIDPDGHPWEVAHNPHWTITPEGGLRLN
jgi:uncharacterized protein